MPGSRNQDDIYQKYLSYRKTKLCSGNKVNENLTISFINDLNLKEYVEARRRLCQDRHCSTPCKSCDVLIAIAQDLIVKGVAPLAELYRKHNTVSYKADKATRLLMQLPVAVFRQNGQLFVVESMPGVDLPNFVSQICNLMKPEQLNLGLDNKILKSLCDLATTEKDKRLIKVAAASGLSQNSAHRELGISNVRRLRDDVENAIAEFELIREDVNDIIECKKNSYEFESSSTDSECLEEEQLDQWSTTEVVTSFDSVQPRSLSNSQLVNVLKKNGFHWCHFVGEIIEIYRLHGDVLETVTEEFYEYAHKLNLESSNLNILNESYSVYKAAEVNRQQSSLSDFCTDSESDNPEDWVKIKSSNNDEEKMKDKVKKQRAIYDRLKKRLIAKEVAKRSLLKQRVPGRVSKTLKRYPNIGNDIEQFARENRIGADSWRRTGLLTFSGNSKTGPKLTYMRMKRYLEDKYNTKFGYGTIVQLCAVKNKRCLSSKRYWGAARVMSRRARKGFNVQMNVDAH
eukprot:Seg1510.1 transcript_id=Seg1510.1/GoldUCD/mRNA.D3Y31 product="hypothetical protein" protein_id=Seg1510.1/GoldUCD/D3Y31